MADIDLYTVLDERFALIEQGTWGTAAGTADASHGIHTAGFDIIPAVNVPMPDRARAQRYQHNDNIVPNEKGVVSEVVVPTPALKDQLDFFVYGCMQTASTDIAEGTATPFQKTFTFPQTQPDFQNNEGMLLFLLNYMPVAAVSHYLMDGVASQLVFSCAPGANDGVLHLEGTVKGRTQVETFTYTGTATYPDVETTDFFYFHDIVTASHGGGAMILGDNGFTITIDTGLIPYGQASGKFQNFAMTEPKVTTTVQALWDTLMRAEMANMRAGTASALTFTWGTTGTDGYLNFALNGKWTEPRSLSKAKEGEFVTMTHTATGLYGTTEPLTLTIANAKDRTW